VAASAATRDCFRRHRALHPCAHDWQKARVPCALSEAEERAAEAAAKAAAKDRKREKEVTRTAANP